LKFFVIEHFLVILQGCTVLFYFNDTVQQFQEKEGQKFGIKSKKQPLECGKGSPIMMYIAFLPLYVS
jgi:hypothetical protein